SAFATLAFVLSPEFWHQITETRLIEAFLMALFAILASELGDRTFIVTTIMAMRYSRVSVFCGAVSAAVFMISLSVLLGVISSLIPESIAYYLSIFLFVFFGVQMLIEGSLQQLRVRNN
ncbi:transmembrane protein 165-like protein, partial [Leptotrombidium deliense]